LHGDVRRTCESNARKDPGNNFRSGQTRIHVQPSIPTFGRSARLNARNRGMSVRLADRCDPGLPILANRRARAIHDSPQGERSMATLERCACAAKNGTSRCRSREVFERRPERGGWFDGTSAKTSPGESPQQQSPSDAGASEPVKSRIATRKRSGSHRSCRAIDRNRWEWTGWPRRPERTEGNLGGDKAQEGQASERRQKRPMVQTVLLRRCAVTRTGCRGGTSFEG